MGRYFEELGLWAGGIVFQVLRYSTETWSSAAGRKQDAIAGMLAGTSAAATGVYAKTWDEIAGHPARYLEELMGSTIPNTHFKNLHFGAQSTVFAWLRHARRGMSAAVGDA